MAEIQNESFNFSIVDTIEGMGSPELLADLLSPETATEDVDNLEKIVKEVEDNPPVKEQKQKSTAPKEKKEETQEGKKEEDKPSEQDVLTNFLLEEEGEEKEKKEEKAEVEETSEEKEEKTQPTVLSSLYKDLLNLGVFTKEDGEDEQEVATPEEFLKRFQDEKVKGAKEMLNNFIGQFGQDYQDAFQAIYVNGVEPKDYFGAYNSIVNFAELDLANEDNQIKVIRQALTDQGLEPDDVNTEVERLKNYGDLETVAAKHHKALVKKEALKLQQMEQKAEAEQLQKTAIKNQYIQNVQNILEEKLKAKEFDGIPVNSKLAQETTDFLLTDKYKAPSGELLTDFDVAILELKRPENHAKKVKVALLLKILEKDPTLSTIQKSGITKKSDELFKEVARQTTKSKTSATGSTNSWFS